jgi:myo-inositol-1(or 4)-monophosphatase
MAMKARYGIKELSRFAMDVIRESGEQALSFYGKGEPLLKFDDSLVTEAENYLNEFFKKKLDATFPDHRFFQNDYDATSYSHEEERYLWVFDALDGVANFQAGIPIWGLSIALMENFWPVFGAFYMPATNDLFYARAGQSAFWNDREISMTSQENLDDESLFLTYSRFHHYYHSRFPGKIRNLGCTGAHISYVAMGRAEAAVIAHVSYPDLAATRIIVEAAGGKFYKVDGGEFFPNEHMDGKRINDHLLVTSPGLANQIRNCLKPAE